MHRALLSLPLAVLVAATGCDDTEFSNGSPVELSGATGWEGVAELFDAECTSCHGGVNPINDLDLETDPCAAIVDVQAMAYAGGLVTAGDSSASVLWHKVADTGAFGGVMPPTGAVDPSAADNLADWINDGAVCD